jgi:hypothetical protein
MRGLMNRLLMARSEARLLPPEARSERDLHVTQQRHAPENNTWRDSSLVKPTTTHESATTNQHIGTNRSPWLNESFRKRILVSNARQQFDGIRADLYRRDRRPEVIAMIADIDPFLPPIQNDGGRVEEGRVQRERR